MKKILSLKGKELFNMADPMRFSHGLQLMNANGDVDTASLGYQYTIQTTTQIRARVIAQKFYKVAPADFFSMVIGTGAWMEDIKTNLTYDVAAAFEEGVISSASGPARIANVDVGTAPITTKIWTWAKGYQYTTPELQKALAADNWDVVSSKMEALKRNWDLGVQKIAFLGMLNDLTNTPGLLTNANVNANTALIGSKISSMSSVDFQTFVAGIIAAYVSNCAYTALPNKFVMPFDDFVGLSAASSQDFPIGSKFEYLLNAFKMATGNPGFQIKPLAYSNAAQNAGYVSTNGKPRYVLYNDDPETIWMDLPVDFTLTPAGTSNNFAFQGVGAGQYSGVTIARPAEVLYLDGQY